MSYLYKRVATSIFQHQRRNILTPTNIYTRNVTTIMSPITLELLTKQNAETSNALIENLGSSEAFHFLSNKEQELTMNRDNEDAIKLEKGIEFAKSKNVLDPNYVPQPYVQIDVLGKTPVMVVGEILDKIKKDDTSSSGGDDSKQGSVVALCGLSGTGKGTTVSTLRKKLEDDEGKQVVTWSNGNIFRSVTLLAVTWCEQQPDIDGFDEEKALTKENLESFMGMLSFGKFKGKYDTRINGLGLDLYVSEVQNTVLKESKVAKAIPTGTYNMDITGIAILFKLWCGFDRSNNIGMTNSNILCSFSNIQWLKKLKVKLFLLRQMRLILWVKVVSSYCWKDENKPLISFEHHFDSHLSCPTNL